MVVAPHPDDESLATGGVLQQARADNAEVRILMVTSGDNNPWVQRLVEHRVSIGPADRRRWAERRQAEARASLECLGLPQDAIRFLNYPDQGLTPMLKAGDDGLVDRLEEEIEDFRPTLLLSPSPADLHPDHSAAAVFVAMALRRLETRIRLPELLEYLVHTRGRPALGGVYLSLTPLQTHFKRKAILCHEAQFAFSRRWFLGFATDRECLIVPGSTYTTNGHGIHLTVDRTSLRFQLHPHASLGAFGPITVSLAAGLAGHTVSRLSIPLPVGVPRESLPIYDHLSSEGTREAKRLLVTAQLHRRPLELRIPRSALPEYDQLWAKCERRFGFFDEMGWVDLMESE
ncbi:MAG TPA: PIG-L family deacetylase [Gemmatimonadales bacterium]|nr:PIG-L family deacetylase [Gemmatimonadales bacterium]